MTDTQYDRARTGLLLVDPCNDFLASEGKLWPFAKEVAEAVDLLAHLRQISRGAMHAAHEINGSTFAHATVTTSELVAALAKA